MQLPNDVGYIATAIAGLTAAYAALLRWLFGRAIKAHDETVQRVTALEMDWVSVKVWKSDLQEVKDTVKAMAECIAAIHQQNNDIWKFLAEHSRGSASTKDRD